jgi:chloramphenicol-sensitive protein RarD
MVAACAIWGLSPIYFRAIAHVPPGEVLAHRALWSAAMFAGVLAVQGKAGALRTLVAARPWRLLLTVVLVSSNWFLFILAVQIGQATQASLGYYIFPLVTVALGMAVLGERLGRAQAVAVGLAALAVGILTVGLGEPPLLALLLATSFGLYGLLKKTLAAPPVVSVAAEVLFVAPPLALWLAGLHLGLWVEDPVRGSGHFGRDWAISLLLVLAGPLTAVPLLLFTYASRRITLTALGLAQYLNPTLQVLVAVLLLREPFGPWHAVAFGLIWVALALYSGATWRADRAARRPGASAATSGTAVT